MQFIFRKITSKLHIVQTIKPSCPSITYTLIFLYRLWVNAVLCKVYYDTVNQTCFAWTVIYCTAFCIGRHLLTNTIRHKSSICYIRTILAYMYWNSRIKNVDCDILRLRRVAIATFSAPPQCDPCGAFFTYLDNFNEISW